MKRAFLATLTAFAAATALIASGTGVANAAPATAYDSTEVAPNIPSLGMEATSASEIGDEIQLAGPGTKLGTVSVQMSSWGCEAMSGGNCATITPGATEAVPITLNVYAASQPGPNGTVVPGALLKSVTQTFAVPYRPGANLAKCTGGRWYNKATKSCFSGKAFNIAFKLKPFKIDVGSGDIVLGVAYNTTHHGYNPIGEGAACHGTPQGCIYDSLNVGLGTTGVHVGSKPHPGTIFWNTSHAGFLCAGAAPNVFNLDSPSDPNCWAGYDTAFKVTTL